MTIVLNENKWAGEMIEAHDLGKKPTETLRRIARYYLNKGMSRTAVRKELDSFLLQCDPRASLPKWSHTMDYAVSAAVKYPSVDIESVEITDAEISKIDALEGKQIKRLAFTLLCLSKYWHSISPKDGYWVNNKDNEIMNMANINTSIKRQSFMYWTLREAGMIQFSKKVDSTNVKVCFITEGNTVIHIKDFRNLGYQYLMYHGEPYFVCANCGITTKISNPQNNRKPKYCNECASKIHMQQIINSVMRQRDKSTETS